MRHQVSLQQTAVNNPVLTASEPCDRSHWAVSTSGSFACDGGGDRTQRQSKMMKLWKSQYGNWTRSLTDGLGLLLNC